jgi:hypothetical protein
MGRQFQLVVEVHNAVGEEYTGATLVDMYLAELAAHAWDLARATGQIDKLDPSLALPALEGARAMIKPQYRNMVEPGAPFGAEVSQLPVLTTGNASPPSWDATHGQRSVYKGRAGRRALDRLGVLSLGKSRR